MLAVTDLEAYPRAMPQAREGGLKPAALELPKAFRRTSSEDDAAVFDSKAWMSECGRWILRRDTLGRLHARPLAD